MKSLFSVYPFGSPMPNRSFSASSYRYGFNGKEKDDELKGGGNSVDFGERIYDSRLGKFLSVDPLFEDYAEQSTYLFANNSPIDQIDVEGEEGGAVSVASAKAMESYNPELSQSDRNIGSAILDFIPFVGTIKGVAEAIVGTDLAGNKLSTTDRVLNIIPAVGAIKKILKAEKIIVATNKAQKTINKVENVGGMCFIKGTLIFTSKGLIPIENIMIGDTVWSYSDSMHIINKQVVYNTVIKQTTRLIVFTINNDRIYTTPDHPFYIDNNWVKAENIIQGDSVLLFNKLKTNISLKTIKDTSCTVYNFAVSNYHTYYVSKQNILVHNNNPCSAAKTKNLEDAAKKNIPKSQLGPSGKPKIHVVEKANAKQAKDAARNNPKSNTSPVKHSSDKGQKTHYHSTKNNEKMSGKDNVHYTDKSTKKNPG